MSRGDNDRSPGGPVEKKKQKFAVHGALAWARTPGSAEYISIHF